MVIPRGDAVALARALIQIDSRNPTLAPDSPGEGDCARTLAAVLDDWGLTFNWSTPRRAVPTSWLAWAQGAPALC